MRQYDVLPLLSKKLQKLSKKDKSFYEQTLNKMDEIIHSENVEHYKNLQNKLKEYKRVHIGSFVLLFKYDKTDNKIIFTNIEHHDNAYLN